jgi:uncharacterized protein (TIGR03118 family)
MNKVCLLGVLLLAAQSTHARAAVANSYTQTNLVSDIPGMALMTDSQLVNPWGLSRPQSPTDREGHWWAADQATGVSTLYDANGAIVPLVITIPSATGTGTGSPTGTNTLGIDFVFTTLDGTISEWVARTAPAPAFFDHRAAAQTCVSCHVTTAAIRVNNSSRNASYTGSTVAGPSGSQTMYVANANGGVEAYDANFSRITLPLGAFKDPLIPAGYMPYGIQAVGKRIYVTFSTSGANPGGYVTAFDGTGKLLVRLQHGAWLQDPWGIAQAPSNFGAFSNALLVGNQATGKIAAFNPVSCAFVGFLRDSNGQPLVIPGLWSIYFGAGNADSGPTNTLYFNAGIQNYTHGLFGAITAN